MKPTDRIKAALERRRSGAAGTHDPRPNRRRQRGQAKRASIKDQQQ